MPLIMSKKCRPRSHSGPLIQVGPPETITQTRSSFASHFGRQFTNKPKRFLSYTSGISGDFGIIFDVEALAAALPFIGEMPPQNRL